MNLAPTENMYMIRRMSSNQVKRDLNITFGKNLKRLRLARGLTQEQLAEMADTDKRYISAMEGGRGIGPSMLTRLCAALGVETEEFVHPQAQKPLLIDEPELSIHHKFVLKMFDVLDSEAQDEVIKFIVKKLPRGKKK